jgi:hypothetical protein
MCVGLSQGSTRHAAAPFARGHVGQRCWLRAGGLPICRRRCPLRRNHQEAHCSYRTSDCWSSARLPAVRRLRTSAVGGRPEEYKERVASDAQLNMVDRWSLEQAIGALEDQTRSLQKVYQELGTGLAVP